MHQSVAMADAWATAFMVLGPAKAYEVAQQQKMAILLITRENTNYKTTMSDTMKAYLLE